MATNRSLDMCYVATHVLDSCLCWECLHLANQLRLQRMSTFSFQIHTMLYTHSSHCLSLSVIVCQVQFEDRPKCE